MTELDRLIAESLHRRAGSLPAAPKSYADVIGRITRRRRRLTSMTAAAVTLPALVAVGWAATRPELGPAPVLDGSGDASAPFATATTYLVPTGQQFRCLGDGYGDGEYTYFDYCELVGVATTAASTLPPPAVVPTGVAFPSVPATSTTIEAVMVDCRSGASPGTETGAVATTTTTVSPASTVLATSTSTSTVPPTSTTVC